jgi:hypothetical protein
MAKVYSVMTASNCGSDIKTESKVTLSGKEAMSILWNSAQSEIEAFVKAIADNPGYTSDGIKVVIDNKGFDLKAEKDGNCMFCIGKVDQSELDIPTRAVGDDMA